MVASSDVSPLSPVLTADNRFVLGLDAAGLQNLSDRVDRVQLAADSKKPEAQVLNLYELFVSDKKQQEKRGQDWPSARFARRARRLSHSQRIQFYLRVKAEYLAKTSGIHLAEALKLEKARTQELLRRLMGVRTAEESEGSRRRNGLSCFDDAHSRGCSISAEVFKKRPEGNAITLDVTRLPRRLFDIVVTDPPYGFNERKKSSSLAGLYANMLPRLVGALRSGGQLVLALPDWSHNGQHFPFFAQREVVTQQVFAAAGELGLLSVSQNQVVPAPAALFRAPYFWESGKALRRSILHFQFVVPRGSLRKVGAPQRRQSGSRDRT